MAENIHFPARLIFLNVDYEKNIWHEVIVNHAAEEQEQIDEAITYGYMLMKREVAHESCY